MIPPHICSMCIKKVGKQEVGIWQVQKCFPQYGIPIRSLWPNIRFLPSIVAEKNATKNILDGRTEVKQYTPSPVERGYNYNVFIFYRTNNVHWFLHSEWLFFNAKWAIFQIYHGENTLHSIRWWWCLLYFRPTRLVGF